MPDVPVGYDSDGPEAYAAAGNALSALGEVLQNGPGPAQLRPAGVMLQAIGTLMGAQAATISATANGASAAAVAGGVIASVAAAYALPLSFFLTAYPPALILLAANPLAAGILSVGFGLAMGWAAWKLGSNVGNALAGLDDLLADILSDPIVLDLNGNGIELVPLANSATSFDLDGDGVAERVGWASPQDGFLVQDSNGNGSVDGVDELFGSANVDGYDKLKTLDNNKDGRIDSADPAFAQLRVWRDLNSDGVSTPNELQTLAEAGIARLNLGYSQVNQNVSGNVIARTGTYVRTDGTSRSMGSVNFALDEPIPVIPDGADLGDLVTLPNLSGQLGLPDLRTAMFFDPILKGMVENLTYGSHDFDTFAEFRDGGFLDILYRWAGIDSSVPLEAGEPPYHIQLLAAFMGRPFEDLTPHMVERLSNEVWGSFVCQLGTTFLVQAADLPALRPFFQMEEALAALSPDDPGFEDALSSVIQSALTASNAATPAYDYLHFFEALEVNPATGEITGNFDTFLTEFLEDQPPYDPGMTGIFIRSSLPPQPSPWLEWYIEQGSLLYSVASLMGFGSDYVDNATGWLWLKEGAALVEGTGGADIISAPSGNQAIFGHDGNDELRGNDGNDRLIGGDGNDLLLGGTGSDMYVYATGDDLDRVTEQSGTDDTTFFSNELNRNALQVTRVAGTNDLLLHFGDQTQGIFLTNQWTSSGGAVDHFNFGPEGTLHAGDIASIYLTTLATAGADSITGSWASERMIALGGDDSLWGLAGDDMIDGGDGIDRIDGGDGNDTATGGAGNDTLYGMHGSDRLAGGTGNDVLYGGAGSDTYVFGRGDGQDVVADDISLGNRGGTDTVELGPDIAPGDVTVVQSGYHLILKINGTTDQITLDNTMNNRGDNERIEEVRFADGTVWTHVDLLNQAMLNNGGDDTFYGGPEADTLTGGGGNDRLYGMHGNDRLVGSTGNDTLYGGAGDDTYVFGRGDGQDIVADDISLGNRGGTDTIELGPDVTPNDVTVVQSGYHLTIKINGTTDQITLDNTMNNRGDNERIEQVRFADGTIWTHVDLLIQAMLNNDGNDAFYGGPENDTLSGGAGDDTLIGVDGDDRLIGGTGNDLLRGAAGSDTYVFNRGDGQDIVADSMGLSHRGGLETIEFGADIAPGDITVVQAGHDLILKINGTTDQITLDQTMDNSGNYERIEQVRFADGTIWTHLDLLNRAMLNNGGNDTFYGGPEADTLTGGAGNDVLIGEHGNDRLVGGTGNDVLRGAAGDDTYVFGRGDGQDVVIDSMGLSHRGGIDTVELGPDITVSDITVVQVGYDLILRINGTSDQITLDQTMDNSGNHERIDQVRFSDGTIWTHTDLLDQAMLNNGGNDTFYGGPESDTLRGGAGDDTLIGVNGDDRLIGGTGNDLLRGAAGNDTYVFNRGDGQDIVMDSMGLSHRGGFETIEFGTDITPGDVTVVQSGYDLILQINGTTDQITLDDTMDNDGNHERIDQVVFADGTTWTHADLLNQAMLNNGGDDTFYGGPEADTLTGGAGNDSLYGIGGNDIMIGGAGVDRLEGGAGADTFRFFEGDSLVGVDADTIVGFAGGSDRIDLSAIDAQSGTPDDQGFTFLGTAAFTQQEGQLRYQVEGSNRRLQADMNGDGVADFEIVLIGTGALTGADFML